MKLKKLLVISLIILVAGLAASGSLFAEVKVGDDFEGTLVVTFPNGDIELLEKGEKLPKIPSDSVLEIFDGKFSVVTGGADQLEIACLDHGATATGGASMSLSCGESSGLLKIEQGEIALTTPDGKVVELGAGDEYIIQLPDAALQAAPPTAAGQGLGIASEDQAPPVDPTGIESRPPDQRPQDPRAKGPSPTE